MDSTERPEGAGHTAAAAPSFPEAALLVDALARDMLGAERYGHSVRVAAEAEALFGRYGLDPEAGRLAGIAHDLCKAMDRDERRSLALGWAECAREGLHDDERISHGPAAAVFLSRRALVLDPAILDAIAWHTVGKPGMSRVAMALYAADKLEPGRSAWRADTRRDYAAGLFDGEGGLERLVADLAKGSVEHVRSRGWAVAPGTLILYNALTGKNL